MATRKRLTAALIAISLLTSCAKPYNVPIVVEEPGQQTDTQFDGLADLLKQSAAQNQPLRILWTHGMCSHDASWALRRVVMAAKALNGVPPEDKGRTTEPRDAYIIESSIPTEFGNVEIGFLVWSPLFKPHKDRLKFDRPGKDGNSSFPYARGKFNNDLKTGLMNDCLSDAVIYSGPNGDPIRARMVELVCSALGGVPSESVACDLTAAKRLPPLALVSESLGSKLFFDAIRTIWNSLEKRPHGQSALALQLSSMQMIYLVSNQIPLLDIATPVDSGQKTAHAAPASSLSSFLSILAEAKGKMKRLSKPVVVAFTDPNDLLSYRLIPSVVGIDNAKLINVIVSNDYTYFGQLEFPTTAHCGYAWNDKVLGLLVHGYHSVGEMPVAPVVSEDTCF